MRQRRGRVRLPGWLRGWLINRLDWLLDYLHAGWDGGTDWRSLNEAVRERLAEDDAQKDARIDEALGVAAHSRALEENIQPLGSFNTAVQSDILKSHRGAAKRREEQRGD
jgi:hypothetical protein